MANISQIIQQIRQAIYGKEVRSSIADGIETVYNRQDEAINIANGAKTKVDANDNRINNIIASSGTSSTEVVDLRTDKDGKVYPVAKGRIDAIETSLAERAYQLFANQFSTLTDAITELNVGVKKILFLPGGTYSLVSPLTVSGDNIAVQLASDAKIISTVSNINTFIFTGKNCSLEGGTIEYPVVFDGANKKWLDNEAVILVKGNGFKAKDVTLNNIYKIGFGIRGASDCSIINNKILGNYPAESWTGVETGHFGIAVDPSIVGGGENVIITNNIVKGCVQGIFIGTYGGGVGYGINISNNIIEGCHNHGIYSNGGVGTIINANSFKRCSLPIAIYGKYATITNNNIHTYSSGNNLDLVSISVREASHCDISHNIIKGDASDNSVVIDLINLAADPVPNDTIDNNIVSHNIIEITSGKVVAIRVGNSTQTNYSYKNQIKDNIIKANGSASGIIAMLIKATGMAKYNDITGNNITMINNCYAIYPYRQNCAKISGNTIMFEYSAVSSETITMINAGTVEDSLITNNILRCESTYGANVTLRGYREDATCNRNLVTGNIVNLDPTLLAAKTEISVNTTSKSVSNMIAGSYVA